MADGSDLGGDASSDCASARRSVSVSPPWFRMELIGSFMTLQRSMTQHLKHVQIQQECVRAAFRSAGRALVALADRLYPHFRSVEKALCQGFIDFLWYDRKIISAVDHVTA